MPRLKRMRWTHSRRICALASISFAANFVSAEETIVIRAVQPLPDKAIVQIARQAAPTILTREAYPDAHAFSANEVISTLCGSVRTAYLQEIERYNSFAITDLNQPLGEAVYNIRWPACAFVRLSPAQRVVKPGENAAQIYEEYTGSKGSKKTIQHFFQKSSVPDISNLKPGQVLIPAHVTAETRIEISDAQKKKNFIQRIQKYLPFGPNNDIVRSLELLGETSLAIGNEAGGRSADITSLTKDDLEILESINNSSDKESLAATADALEKKLNPPSGNSIAHVQAQAAPAQEDRPKLEIGAGRIESTGSVTYETPRECTQTPAKPFDALRVESAFQRALEIARLNKMERLKVQILVADNGFFGARYVDGVLQFGQQFPQEIFLDSNDQVGPYSNATESIHPLNYNLDLPVTPISGHGTHIAGLILGGPDFQKYLKEVTKDESGSSRLQISMLNIGAGQEYLRADSIDRLVKQLKLRKDDIVNMSVTYQGGTASGNANNIYLGLFIQETAKQRLYVVAAGNSSQPSVSDALIYPASFGGELRENVVTVAAHRGDGSLTKFGNRGPHKVDIAAPGCALDSWLDETVPTTPASGTSQATALVTFTAALLRTLADQEPVAVKNRLIASGQLLIKGTYVEDGNESDNPDPEEIFSKSRLDIARALYLFDDYVKFRPDPEKPEVVEELGTVVKLAGISCPPSTPSPHADTWNSVWSYKTGKSGTWLYKGRNNPSERMEAPCHPRMAKEPIVIFQAIKRLNTDGTLSNAPSTTQRDIPLAQVDTIVAASVPVKKK